MGTAASVIIPAYNSEHTIQECVTALRKQDYSRGFEIIVVDDGSKDKTGEAAREAGARVITQENAGPAKARNAGAKQANGAILVFTDADCTPEKDWLSEMLAPFSREEVAGVQGAYATRQKSLVARFAQAEIEERYARMERLAAQLDWIGSYSAAYRRQEFFSAGGFDESFPKASGEDPELSYKLQKAGKKLAFNRKALVYHTHPDTLAKYFRTKFYRGFYRVKLYSKHKDKIIRDSYTPQTIKLQVGLLALAAATAATGLYRPGMALAGLAGIAALFTASTAPLAASSYTKWGTQVAIATPFMVLTRTAAFCLGLAAGMVKR